MQNLVYFKIGQYEFGAYKPNTFQEMTVILNTIKEAEKVDPTFDLGQLALATACMLLLKSLKRNGEVIPLEFNNLGSLTEQCFVNVCESLDTRTFNTMIATLVGFAKQSQPELPGLEYITIPKRMDH